MLEQIKGRFGCVPADVLVDGGFASLSDIEKVSSEAFGSTVYAPPMTPRGNRSRSQTAADDTEAIAEWRTRMETPEAKEIYKQRAATAECVNAHFRNRGLRQFLVRGLEKVRAVLLLQALAHDLMRGMSLRQEACPVA